MRALLVHGAGGGAWEWQAWRPVLEAAGIAAEAIELEPAPGGLAATGYADYLAQVLEAGRGCEALVGASLGGLLAAEAASPLGVRALALVNPVPPAPWHRLLPERAWPKVVPWASTSTLEGTREALPDATEETVREAARRWRDESGRVLAEAWAGRRVGRPQAALLVIAGAEDRDLPPAIAAALAHAWDAEYLELPGCGHLSPLLGRSAPAVAARVAEWVREAGRRRAAEGVEG
ncbi:MAG: alpha/beta hydrolase family protein [Xanthomonadales bacterium]|nr:alpha/beta hydrolase family protein [Xanthomonadales bacterium]